MKNLSDDLLVIATSILFVATFTPELWIGLTGLTTLLISTIINRKK